VIKGVKVGSSPAWLAARLEAIGQRPINNVVDVTNFVLFELGNPCHAFDLAKLAGRSLHVRTARAKEQLVTLDGTSRVMKGNEVVICDANGPTSLAGIMGGLASSVTSNTTDIVIEMATWDPVKVRTAARAHQLRTSASSRYERIVDARTLVAAMDRACELILHVAGGSLCEGQLDVHAQPKPATTITLRPSRVHALLGVEIETDTIVRCLQRLEIDVGPVGRGGEVLLCTVPVHRPDLTREVDLIEEVARLVGFDKIVAKDRVLVPVQSAQHDELARRSVAGALAAQGFFETITFSFATPKAAALSTHAGLEPIVMDDARRGDEPALRSSPLTGLLAARAHNQNAGASQDGGVRLFELASAFMQKPLAAGTKLDDHSVRSVEKNVLALLMDAPGTKVDHQREGVRLLRGAIEAVVRSCTGDARDLKVTPLQTGSKPVSGAYDDRGFAQLQVRDAKGVMRELGCFGLASKAAMQTFALDHPVLIAELDMHALVASGPVRSKVVLPPGFPSIERDVSLIVDERVMWATIEHEVQAHAQAPLESVAFVTTFRGPQVGEGKKSVTMRLAYRDATRTLTHSEIDAPVQQLLSKLKEKIAFEIRT
jgi:phenylalanyl-tRNA synthetase beta chain